MTFTLTRKYKNIAKTEFVDGRNKLTPIRDEDKYAIMQWRNEQIDILRQAEPLTKEKQEWYFANVVDKLFETDKPAQLLFSYFEDDKLIGYGGLVHIDWQGKNAEISFITETNRNTDPNQFISDWCNYLNLIKTVSTEQLNFTRIYTYAYDLRPHLYTALIKSGFILDERLKDHVVVNNTKKDVLIHSCFLNDLVHRRAEESDMEQYFEWANDKDVRNNSFSPQAIQLADHKNWFNVKLKQQNCYMYVFLLNGTAVGQVRIEEDKGEMIIDISIDKNQRGKGLGVRMLNDASKEFFELNSNDTLFSYVRKENQASLKIFQKANFKTHSEVEVKGMPTYKLSFSAKTL